MSLTSFTLDVGALIEENRKLKLENDDMKKQLKAKDVEISELISYRKSVDELQEENRKLKQENADLKQRIAVLEEKVVRLETTLCNIDVREAIRSLENYIVLDVLGSKTQMVNRNIYTISDLKKTEEYQKSKWHQQKENKIFNLINYFKKSGDIVIHNGELKSNQEELAAHMREHISDLGDEEYESVVEEMVLLLSTYCETYKKPFGR
jgi:regulator of replication initiation timing